MNRRKAFKDILHHKTPDRVILDLGGCPLSGMDGRITEKMLKFYGFRTYEEILQELDIDTRGVGWILNPQKSQVRTLSNSAFIDAWGIKREFSGLYWDITESPLNGATVDDLENYPWPDAESVSTDEINQIVQSAKYLYEETDYIICASHPVFGIFELGCWMCGFEDFMLKMAAEPEFVHCFFEIILNYQKKVIELYYDKLGKYIHYTSSGDDFATQASTMMSPAMFDEFIAPYFKERISYTKQFTDAPYLHHSCGNVYKIIPSLIDCGVDILNPIQPCAKEMEAANLKKTYGDKIVFHGGFDTQEILPFGSREEIESEVEELLTDMMPKGGYIFAAAHNIQDDVPVENVDIIFKAARNFKLERCKN